MLSNLWPVRHRRNRSSKMQQPTTTANVAGKWRIHYSHKQQHHSPKYYYYHQHNVSHKCFIWIVAWLSLFAILTQAQVNLYSAPSQKQQSSNTSTQSTSAPFRGNSPQLTLTALQRIPLGAISNSGKGSEQSKVYKYDTTDTGALSRRPNRCCWQVK